MEPWQQEGTIGFFLPEDQPGWRTDGRRHDLPTLRINRFRVTLSKTEEQMLTVTVYDLLDVPVVLQTPLPDGSEPLHLTIIWRAEHIQLCLDGEAAALLAFPDVDAVRRSTYN